MNKFVLVKKPAINEMICGFHEESILSDSDGGMPLLFDSEEEAKNYFNDHANGQTMEQLNAYVRPATKYDLLKVKNPS